MVSQSRSAAYTITGKTVDLTDVQKTLTPSTRRVSHKSALLKRLAVNRVLYPSVFIES